MWFMCNPQSLLFILEVILSPFRLILFEHFSKNIFITFIISRKENYFCFILYLTWISHLFIFRIVVSELISYLKLNFISGRPIIFRIVVSPVFYFLKHDFNFCLSKKIMALKIWKLFLRCLKRKSWERNT